MKYLYWLLGALVIALGLFLSMWLDGTQKTVPKITMSYFSDEGEVAKTVLKRLDQEIGQNSAFWVGIEPEKKEQIAVLQALKSELEAKNGKFDEVFVDSELQWPSEILASLQVTQNIALKANIDLIGPVLLTLEKNNKKYLFITASLYSNSFVKENQLHQLKQKYGINPMTISLGLFAATPEEENDLTFRCSTNDSAGTAGWGCALVNKARTVRRKYKNTIQKPWAGVMDLTGEKDYMFLLRKKP